MLRVVGPSFVASQRHSLIHAEEPLPCSDFAARSFMQT